MKFLCLHGMGTNNQIFKMQTGKHRSMPRYEAVSTQQSILVQPRTLNQPNQPAAAFRYELSGEHTYEFVQGTFPCDLPIELAALSSPGSQHYSYYDTSSPASFIAALDSLEAYIEIEGPFDGVMAYSQGAGLVAMLLVRRQYLKSTDKPLFRCAILFSPIQVYDPVAYLERGEISVLKHVAPGMALPLPVVIVYGEADERKQECRGVQNICDSKLLSVFVHDGGHEIPGIGVKGGLVGTVRMARRGLTRAELAVD